MTGTTLSQRTRADMRAELPTIISELALLLLTVAAALSLDRMFLDTEHRTPLIVTAVVVHGVLMVTRRLRAGVALSFAASLIALVFAVTNSLFSETSRFGIPTGDTLTAVREQAELAWSDFNTVRAPTASTTGFILATIIAVWAVAFLSDWAAFRLRTAGEAMVPGLAVVIFSALLTVQIEGGEVRHVAWFLAAAVFFLVAHRSAARVRTGTWLGNQTSGAYRALMAGGGLIAVATLAIGLLAGPQIPGAKDEALVELNDLNDSGPSERIAQSPLIDIRSRLVDLPDVEAFTVSTNSPGYWRTMALDSFDGTTWTLKADFSNADGTLENKFQTDVTTERVDQTFSITGLDMDWLPAAFTPTEIDVATGQKVTYEASLSTLIVDDTVSVRNMRYTVSSDRPVVTAADLQNSPASDIDERYTALPANFDPRIRALAEELTQGATDDYGKALALQNWFRDPNEFTYSLAAVAPGHDQDAILNFLEARVGYCEQFAGTFAAMARSIGLPTRIAVGFTDGEADPNRTGLYRVSGKHAHSWPEVYIEGAGWLHFEPTPGRGAAASAGYTGVQQQQVDQAESVEQEAESLPNPTPGPGALTTDQAPQPEAQPDTSIEPEPQEPEEQAEPDEEQADDSGFSLPRSVLYTLLGLLALAVYVVGIPWLKRSRRRSERDRAKDHRERVNVAWQHTTADLQVKGMGRSPNETHIEYAQRAGDELGLEQLRKMGELASAATFSPGDLPEWVADQAEAHEDAIKSVLDARTTKLDRTFEELNPRPLLSRQ